MPKTYKQFIGEARSRITDIDSAAKAMFDVEANTRGYYSNLAGEAAEKIQHNRWNTQASDKGLYEAAQMCFDVSKGIKGPYSDLADDVGEWIMLNTDYKPMVHPR